MLFEHYLTKLSPYTYILKIVKVSTSVKVINNESLPERRIYDGSYYLWALLAIKI